MSLMMVGTPALTRRIDALYLGEHSHKMVTVAMNSPRYQRRLLTVSG